MAKEANGTGVKEELTSFLETWLVPPVKGFLEPLHGFLGSLPASVWRGSICVLLLAGTLWTLCLKKESIFRGSPSPSRWRDLRIWVCLLVVPYLLIYLFL